MNKRAKELGAECTNFINPSGMDNTSDGHLHVSSAYDLAIMARHAMSLPEFREIVKRHITLFLLQINMMKKFF